MMGGKDLRVHSKRMEYVKCVIARFWGLRRDRKFPHRAQAA